MLNARGVARWVLRRSVLNEGAGVAEWSGDRESSFTLNAASFSRENKRPDSTNYLRLIGRAVLGFPVALAWVFALAWALRGDVER